MAARCYLHGQLDSLEVCQYHFACVLDGYAAQQRQAARRRNALAQLFKGQVVQWGGRTVAKAGGWFQRPPGLAALTALGVFKLQFWPRPDAQPGDRPGAVALIAATIFVGLSGWMLYFAFTSPLLNTVTLPVVGKVSAPLVWIAFVALITVVYAAWTAARRPRAA